MNKLETYHEWNDSLGDLNRIGSMEEQIILAIQNQDHKNLYKWLVPYKIYLYSIIKFDCKELDKKLERCLTLINKADLDQDGELDEYEQRQSFVDLSEALALMKEIFSDLRIHKVENGLSVNLSEIKQELKNLEDVKYLKKWIDTNILKDKGDLELIFLQKLSLGYVKQ